MATAYSMTDKLPKDQENQKFGAMINDESSQLDFALMRGIGVETLGGTSKNVVHQAVGSHTIGSALGHTVGILLLGAYTEAPSAIGQGNVQALRTDSQGALYVRPASGLISTDATSANIHVSGSCLLHGYHIFMSDVNAGDAVIIRGGVGGDDYYFAVVATETSQVFAHHFSVGVFIPTLLKHVRVMSGAGTASVTLIYSQY